MHLEVIVPSLRVAGVNRLLESLSLSDDRPDMVSLITNELRADPIDARGLPVRLLRFRSNHYAIGVRDVALRQNVGLWHTQADAILFAGDDQIAPLGMIADWRRALDRSPVAWGHHRWYADAAVLVADLVRRPLTAGVSREQGVNRWHGYWSAYSGSFGAHTAVLREAGGLDMLFLGRHAGEDQNLGRRLSRRFGGRPDQVFVQEPPCWWHPAPGAPPEPCLPTVQQQTCRYQDVDCARHWHAVNLPPGMLHVCPWCAQWRYDGDDPNAAEPVIAYRPDWVTVTEERLA